MKTPVLLAALPRPGARRVLPVTRHRGTGILPVPETGGTPVPRSERRAEARVGIGSTPSLSSALLVAAAAALLLAGPAAAAAPAPAAWALPPASEPTVLLGMGLWWDFFGLSEAMAELPAVMVVPAYHSNGRGGCDLRGLPGSAEGLSAHNLVILANVPAGALGPARLALLEDFVRGGGGLLVCGGPFAFGGGGYGGTAFDRLLPCETNVAGRARVEGGLVVEAGEPAAGIVPADLAWKLEPRVFYGHEAEPRPGARVLARMGGKPLLIAGECGAGRVAIVAASVEGEPEPGQLAFWEWGDWARLMGGVCRWLVAAPRQTARRGLDESDRKVLADLAVPGPGGSDEKRLADLRRVVSRCSDAAAARELLTAVLGVEGTPDPAFVDAVAEAIRPFVDAASRTDAEALMESGNPGKIALGARVLGMSRVEGAGARLADIAKRGTEAIGRREADLLGDGGDLPTPGMVLGTEERVRLAAAQALGDAGGPEHVEALRRISAQFATQRQQMLEITEMSDLNESLYQQSLVARCRLGDASAVAPLLDVVLRNAGEIVQFQNFLDVMLVNKDDKALLHGRKLAPIRIPVLRRRALGYAAAFRRFPISLAGPLAQEVLRRDAPDLAPYILAGLGPAPGRAAGADAAAVLPLLGGSTIPTLRHLAFRVAMAAGDGKARGEVAAALAAMAEAPGVAPATYAVRRVTELDPAARATVLGAALRNPDGRVRRLAALYLPLLSAADRARLEAPAAGGNP